MSASLENVFLENAFLEFGLETSSLERVALAGRVPCEKVFLERCCDVEGDVVVGEDVWERIFLEETETCVSEVMPFVSQVIDGGSEIGVLQATLEEDCQSGGNRNLDILVGKLALCRSLVTGFFLTRRAFFSLVNAVVCQESV